MRILRNRTLLATLIATSVWIGWGAWTWATEEDFTAFKLRIRERFPSVAQLSTADLAAWLNDPKRGQPILLDVRTEKEFAVSHLPGATRVEPSAKVEKVLAQLPPGRAVVTYCSVGYRSSDFAERLKQAGAAEVFNLEGSIFQWANEGRPIEADGHPADKVHPYNRKFGRMLDEKKRANP